MSKKSALEEKFATVFAAACPQAPEPERQFRFHPERKWRFDFAWPKHLVAVEIDGGIFVGGGHNRGVQFTQDCEKINAATMLGWRVLRFTTLSLRREPVQCAEMVGELLSLVPARDIAIQTNLFTNRF